MYRQYEDDGLVGEPVELRAAVLRKLVGRKVEWLERRWHRKRIGVLDGVKGNNVSIDGNWYWRPDIKRMTVHPEESTNG